MKHKLLCLNLLIQLFLISNYQCANHSVWNGEKYDKNSSMQYKTGVEAIESFKLQGNEKVLDIGCGNGKITALCAARLPSGTVVGIDISSSMIDFAHKQYGSGPNVTFLVEDVTTMTFDQEFDLIYSLFCLHWIKDQEVAIKNIAKSLKIDGKAVLYISIPDEFNRAFKDEFNKLVSIKPWSAYSDKLIFNHYASDPEIWLSYAKQNNLSAHFNIIHNCITFDDYDTFKQRLTAYGVCCEALQVLGKDQGNLFVDCYLENVYKALGLDMNEPISWQFDIMVLTLTK